jgi:hypothetical protein
MLPRIEGGRSLAARLDRRSASQSSLIAIRTAEQTMAHGQAGKGAAHGARQQRKSATPPDHKLLALFALVARLVSR